ncbi:MAG TPA: heavy metal-binding domain-containing protein [Vicinamibacterales bacterium]|nr:heavy metal-binding domain-containing protein [Vicinamibacterales bacterium]
MRRSRLALLLVALLSLGAAQQGGTPPADVIAWFCPMHPEVTAGEAGRCRKCGMALVAGDPFDTREYSLELTTMPAAVKAGQPATLFFTVRHPGTSALITQYELVHEKPYHLFVVSNDMEFFEHVHPTQQPDGRWAMEVTLPRAGDYRVLSDFLPTGGSPQFVGRTLETAGFTGDLESQQPHLQPDTVFSRTVGSITAHLDLEPSTLVEGQYGHLAFTLTDAKTGRLVTDLQPYLGAFGHALILSEDMRDYVHSHPFEGPESDVSKGAGGPTVTFELYMPRAGKYRAWSQFQRNGEVVTVPFTVNVATVDEAYRNPGAPAVNLR